VSSCNDAKVCLPSSDIGGRKGRWSRRVFFLDGGTQNVRTNFLTYTNATAVPYQGSVLGHHIVLNYVDSNGKYHTLQGTPEHKFEHNAGKLAAFLREQVLSDGTSNRDSLFGRLKVEPENVDDDLGISRPHTMIAEGEDLSSQWAQMKRFGDHVNSIGYEYRPYSQNSNSFAAGAFKHAGFFGPGTAFPEIFDDRLLAVDPVSGATSSPRSRLRPAHFKPAQPDDNRLERTGGTFRSGACVSCRRSPKLLRRTLRKLDIFACGAYYA